MSAPRGRDAQGRAMMAESEMKPKAESEDEAKGGIRGWSQRQNQMMKPKANQMMKPKAESEMKPKAESDESHQTL